MSDISHTEYLFLIYKALHVVAAIYLSITDISLLLQSSFFSLEGEAVPPAA